MVPCPRRRLRDHTAGLLSRRWTLRIVIALSTGVKRRSELSRLLPGVTQKVLTETLREMERTGMIERIIFPTIPPHVEYPLTIVGSGLLRLSSEFATWFDAHHEDTRKSQRIYDKQNGLQ